MSGTRLVLSRHGQTVWHRENRYAGTSDVDLTDEGHRQADVLAAWALVERPDVVASSPVRRALETARPVAAALGLRPLVRHDLREVSFGVAEGRTMAEMTTADPAMVEAFRADPVTHHFPDAEDPVAAADRAARALRSLAVEHEGATVLVVAHNTLLRLALCRLLGIDVRRYRTVFPRLDNGTLTHLVVATTGEQAASLTSFNVPLGGTSGPTRATRPTDVPPPDPTPTRRRAR